MMTRLFTPLLFTVFAGLAKAEPIFLEAETFSSDSDGWTVAESAQTRAASDLKTLHGAAGETAAVARKPPNSPRASAPTLQI